MALSEKGWSFILKVLGLYIDCLKVFKLNPVRVLRLKPQEGFRTLKFNTLLVLGNTILFDQKQSIKLEKVELQVL